MRGSAPRLGLAAALLVGVWILTYWLWPAPGAGDVAPISFDEPAPAVTEPPAQAAGVLDPLVADGAPAAGAAEGAAEPTTDAEPGEEAAAQGAPTGPYLVPPEFREYVVERGDSVGVIARKVYGDEGLAMVIAQANPLTDVAKLRAGQRLRVPVDPENIQGRLMDPATGKYLPVERDTALPGRITEYVVERDDTLGGIAKALYGRATLWPLILDANQHLIKSPDDIRPGMRLIIPPPPPSPARR